MFGVDPGGTFGAIALLAGIVLLFVLAVLAFFMPLFVYRIKCSTDQMAKEAKETNRQLKALSDALAENQSTVKRAVDVLVPR